MIRCPFCQEEFNEDELVFEFRWGDIASHYYNKGKLLREPQKVFADRTIYVRLDYDRRGNTYLGSCDTVVNPARHSAIDPLCSDENEWTRVVQLLTAKNVFEVECDEDNPDVPTGAFFSPLQKGKKKDRYSVEGKSTGTFCPHCEQELKPDVLNADQEIRILLVGRPGSGKTVYVTQLLSDLIRGRMASSFTVEPANRAVDEHYNNNSRRLQAFASDFIMATNPGEVQEPYVYLMRNNETSIRLVIQDIAGEDTEDRLKYNKVVHNADIVLMFIDPWHISEVRSMHEQAGDETVELVRRFTGGKYYNINGVFQQIMNSVDRRTAKESGQLAGVILIKGDYINPPMLAKGAQPECQMMSHPISYGNPRQMEFEIGMRSSFVRQCLSEWSDPQAFLRSVENVYPAANTRYFIVSALGKSTHIKLGETANDVLGDINNPDAQFATPTESGNSGAFKYDEQVMDSTAVPENVMDPVFWCLKRRGVRF